MLPGPKTTRGVGVVVGHRDTVRGPFIQIQDAQAKVRDVRPAHCSAPTGEPAPRAP
jgi:hypothetical protein